MANASNPEEPEKPNARSIRASENHLRRILDSMFAFVAILSREGTVLEVNLAPLAAADLKRDDVLHRRFEQTYWINHSPQTQAQVLEAHQRALAGETVRGEFQIRVADDVFIVVDGVFAPIADEHGAVIEVVASGVDITARKQAEDAARESQRVLANLLSNLPGMAYRCRNDPAWTMEFVSEGATALTGYPVAHFLDNTITFGEHITHPEDRQMVWDRVQAALRDHRPYRLNYRIITADGRVKWVWEQGSGVFDERGALQALEGLVIDVSDRRRAELALQTLNEELETRVEGRTAELEATARRLEEIQRQQAALLHSVPDIAWLKDEHSRFIAVNHALAAACGRTIDDLPGKTDLDIWPRELAERYRADDRRVMAGRTMVRVEEPLVDRDGRQTWIETIKVPIIDAEGKVTGTAGIARDITARKRLEGSLRKVNEELDQLVAQRTRSLEEEVAERRRVEEALRANQDIFETAQQVAHIGSWSSDPHDEGRLTWSAETHRIFGLPPSQFDGRVETFFALVHPDDVGAVKAAVAHALESQSEYSIEHRIIRPDGAVRWVHEQAEIVRNERGEPLQLIGVVQDITERVLADDRQRRMMQELDHRVKNNLAGVLSLAKQTLAASRSLEEFGSTFFGRITAMARTHEALARSHWEVIDVSELARIALGLFIEGPLPAVTLQGERVLLPARMALPLCLALHELATNAAKYGALSVATGRVMLEWRRTDGVLRLRWQETEGPTVQPPLRAGTGTRLIDGFIRFELHGKVQSAYLPAGLICELEIPLSPGTVGNPGNPGIPSNPGSIRAGAHTLDNPAPATAEQTT